MKTFCKMLLAIVIAGAVALGAMALNASDNFVLTLYFCGALVLCTVFGVFDIKDNSQSATKHDSITDASRSMREQEAA